MEELSLRVMGRTQRVKGGSGLRVGSAQQTKYGAPIP